MGNVAGYRTAWIQAEAYRRRWDAWLAGNRQGDAPTRDLGQETLAEVLRGNILVHNHCYRADEMAQMIDIAREFGYRSARSTTASRPTRWPTSWRATRSRARSGPTGGVQDGGARRHSRQHRARARRGRARHRALGRPVGVAAPQPGGGQVARRRPRDRPRRDRGRRDQVDHDQRRVGAGPARPDRVDRAGEERRRGALVGEPVQRVRPRGEGVGRRGDDVRPAGPAPQWRTDFELGFVPAPGTTAPSTAPSAPATAPPAAPSPGRAGPPRGAPTRDGGPR
jgi:hypothetical protein